MSPRPALEGADSNPNLLFTRLVCTVVKSNYTLFSVWGIPIRVNISLLVFLPVLVWLVGSGEQLAAYESVIETVTLAEVDAASLTDGERWLIGVGAAVGLFASVTVHELGHAWVAMRYGIGVESITLWILGGLASLAEMPRQWNREFWIAVAGPVASLLVAAVCVGAVTALPTNLTIPVFVVGFLAVTNAVLAVFNMIPAFPMDGGRVLRALLGRTRSYASATQTAAGVGRLFAILFAVVGVVVVFSPVLILLALFVYVAATGESRSVVVAELLRGLTVADIMVDTDPVDAGVSAGAVFDRMLGSRRQNLAVSRDGRVVGAVTGDQLQDVPAGKQSTATAGGLATTDLPRVDEVTPAFDALSELQRSGSDTAIVERDGVPIGVVSQADFAAVLDLRRETASF